MNKPNVARVQGHDIPISWIPSDTQYHGYYDSNAPSITVAEAQKINSAKAETLLHECLHAIWDRSSIQTELCEEWDTKQVEEYYVQALSNPLRQFMKDNPEIVRFIQDN